MGLGTIVVDATLVGITIIFGVDHFEFAGR
jgi:hypothetical protein